MTSNVSKTASQHHAALKMRWFMACALALPTIFLSGCKKEATPEPEVTVQAEHPEQGSISEHITADAILSPLAQAAIAPRISAPVNKVLRPARRAREGRRVAGDT